MISVSCPLYLWYRVRTFIPCLLIYLFCSISIFAGTLQEVGSANVVTVIELKTVMLAKNVAALPVTLCQLFQKMFAAGQVHMPAPRYGIDGITIGLHEKTNNGTHWKRHQHC